MWGGASLLPEPRDVSSGWREEEKVAEPPSLFLSMFTLKYNHVTLDCSSYLKTGRGHLIELLRDKNMQNPARSFFSKCAELEVLSANNTSVEILKMLLK